MQGFAKAGLVSSSLRNVVPVLPDLHFFGKKNHASNEGNSHGDGALTECSGAYGALQGDGSCLSLSVEDSREETFKRSQIGGELCEIRSVKILRHK